MHEANRGPLKDTVSAQKALQGSETERAAGKNRKVFLRQGDIDLTGRIFFYLPKGYRKKIALVARPGGSTGFPYHRNSGWKSGKQIDARIQNRPT